MKIVAGIIPTFPLPKASPFNFHEVYHAQDDQSMQRLVECTQLRNAVVAATIQQDSVAAAMAIDQYLPALTSVMAAFEALPGGFYNYGAPSTFTWTSGGDKTSITQKPAGYTLYTLSYEKCMVAATRAYCECNLAARELEAPGVGDEASKRALAFLKSAAALFNSIAGQLLPLKESLPVSRAPEVTPQYNLGLAQLCRLSCQLLAINQAIIRGMAQGTIAKLYAGASQLGYGALHTLTKLQHDYKDLDPSLKNYLNGSHHYLMAVGYRLAAVGEWSDGKHGEATGHINDSKRLFGTAYGAGLMSHASKSLSERVEADRTATIELHVLYEKDNGLVYFGKVPKEEVKIEAKLVAAEVGMYAFPPGNMQLVISPKKVTFIG